MFCPACSAYLTERDLIKTSVKYAPGNVPIEYDARCPKCSAEMGKVSWGQLTVNPELAAHPPKAPEPPAAGPESGGPLDSSAQAAQKMCPHCGKPLPKDF